MYLNPKNKYLVCIVYNWRDLIQNSYFNSIFYRASPQGSLNYNRCEYQGIWGEKEIFFYKSLNVLFSDWRPSGAELHQWALAPALRAQLGDEQAACGRGECHLQVRLSKIKARYKSKKSIQTCCHVTAECNWSVFRWTLHEWCVMFRETVHNGKKLHVTRVGLRIRLTRDHFHWGKLKVRQNQIPDT